MTNAVNPKNRIVVLDILRGFALLGILLVNIISFAMVSCAYDNPSLASDFSLVNKLSWMFTNVFAEGKFMAIFSMLFGASILLFCEHLENKVEDQNFTRRIFFRRNFLLLAMGLIHAYFIWFGDVLVCYALCSFVLYFLRNLSPRIFLSLGISMLMVPVLIVVLISLALPYMPQQEIDKAKAEWTPTAQQIKEEINIWQSGTWSEQQSARIKNSFVIQTEFFFFYSLWWAMGWMLLGMFFYKTGIIIGNREPSFYRNLFFHFFCIGLTLTLIGVYNNLEQNFSFEYSAFLGTLWHYLGAIPLAISYVAFVILFAKSNLGCTIKQMLASVGKMSLTNYLAQSVICSFIFYSFGFALFGKTTYSQTLCIVFIIWLFQIAFSYFWLKIFTFGPCEKLWRYFTYKRDHLPYGKI